MKAFLTVLVAMSLGAPVGYAQDDPLPQSVARAYLAYEQAVEAGDAGAATEAARAAWQAARDERIDQALTGILAENYAGLAQTAGAHVEAYTAWRDAAEISGRTGAPAPEQATRWYNAGVAALANGAILDANRCLMRSARLQPDAGEAGDLDLFGNTHYLIAATNAQLGQLRGLGDNARAAVSAFQASEHAFDSLYADAYYLSGIEHYARGRFVQSAVDINMARGILTAAGNPERATDLATFSMWLLLAQENLNATQQARLDEELAASPFPPEADDEVAPPSDENNHDAAPLRRAAPRYPREAAQRGLEGVVLIRFNVNAQGATEDIQVVTAIPSGVFEAAVRETVERWQYEPALRDGQPVPRTGVETAMVFVLR